MKKKIIISSLLLMSGLNASYFYKIDLNSNNNSIIVNNELPSSPIEESAIDENPNSEENINQWAVFLQNHSNYYLADSGGGMGGGEFTTFNNSYQNREEPPIEEEPIFCEREPCYPPAPQKMSVEEIAEILKTPDAVISVDGYSGSPVVFPTELGLNNTIKSLRFEPVVNTISGMDNVQVIQESFRVDFAPITSYESLSNLRTIGGYLEIFGTLDGSLSGTDFSFLRNLESVQGILVRGIAPLNLSQVNRNLTTNYLTIDARYSINEEDSYWLRDKVEDGSIGSLHLMNLENTNLKMFEGLTHLERMSIYGFDNLTNLDGLQSAITADEIEIWYSDALINLQGLENLTTADYIAIRYNDNLSSTVGLEGLTTARILNLASNNLNDLSGLQNLISVDGISLSHNDLPNLDGLENLRTINEEIYIRRNFNLKNLNGLRNLETLGTLDLEQTPVEDISGLAGLTNVTGLVILQERQGGFLVKLPSNSYLCRNSGKLRMYTLDGNSWNLNEVCE